MAGSRGAGRGREARASGQRLARDDAGDGEAHSVERRPARRIAAPPASTQRLPANRSCCTPAPSSARWCRRRGRACPSARSAATAQDEVVPDHEVPATTAGPMPPPMTSAAARPSPLVRSPPVPNAVASAPTPSAARRSSSRARWYRRRLAHRCRRWPPRSRLRRPLAGDREATDAVTGVGLVELPGRGEANDDGVHIARRGLAPAVPTAAPAVQQYRDVVGVRTVAAHRRFRDAVVAEVIVRLLLRDAHHGEVLSTVGTRVRDTDKDLPVGTIAMFVG